MSLYDHMINMVNNSNISQQPFAVHLKMNYDEAVEAIKLYHHWTDNAYTTRSTLCTIHSDQCL